MADWSALTEGFMRGRDSAQQFRANKQLERRREQMLEFGGRDLAATAGAEQDLMHQFPGETEGMQPFDWDPTLDEPMGIKLGKKIKSFFSGAKTGKKQKALDLGGEGNFNTSNPVGTGEEEPAGGYAPLEEEGFADGGGIMQAMEQARGQTQSFANQANQLPQTTVQAAGGQPVASPTGVIDTGRNYADGGLTEEEKVRERAARSRARNPGSVERATESVRGADRTVRSGRKALDVAEGAAGKSAGRLSRLGGGLKKLGAAGALGATAIETATTPTEDYRERFGLETDSPSLVGDIGVRTLGAASDLGSVLTFGAADRLYRDKQRHAAETGQPAATEPSPQAIPVNEPRPPLMNVSGGGSASMSRRSPALPSPAGSDTVDFGAVEMDPKDVPDMKTDEWRDYRKMVIRDATRRGQPIDQVNERITAMQQKNFLNYGQQGLALQQAGNTRGAMAAYRAAFQYFPNGNDVEFGTSKNKRTGREQIVGFGKDEKTGKVVPGTELIMDPERVATLLENFTRPEAFRMWTKDWRDFKQNQKRYEEVTKPLAQAQADSLANNSEARILAAENAALRARGAGGAGGAANMRNAERVFRERLGMMGLQDEAQADYLASIMSQIKISNPTIPDNTIVQVIMQAQRDGSLQQRLQQMGIGSVPAQQSAPRQALPMTPAQ